MSRSPEGVPRKQPRDGLAGASGECLMYFSGCFRVNPWPLAWAVERGVRRDHLHRARRRAAEPAQFPAAVSATRLGPTATPVHRRVHGGEPVLHRLPLLLREAGAGRRAHGVHRLERPAPRRGDVRVDARASWHGARARRPRPRRTPPAASDAPEANTASSAAAARSAASAAGGFPEAFFDAGCACVETPRSFASTTATFVAPSSDKGGRTPRTRAFILRRRGPRALASGAAEENGTRVVALGDARQERHHRPHQRRGVSAASRVASAGPAKPTRYVLPRRARRASRRRCDHLLDLLERPLPRARRTPSRRPTPRRRPVRTRRVRRRSPWPSARFRCARAASKPNARAGSVRARRRVHPSQRARAADAATTAGAAIRARDPRAEMAGGPPRHARKKAHSPPGPRTFPPRTPRARRAARRTTAAPSRVERGDARGGFGDVHGSVSEHERDVRHVPVLVPVLRGQTVRSLWRALAPTRPPPEGGVQSGRLRRRLRRRLRLVQRGDARGDVETQSVRFSVL